MLHKHSHTKSKSLAEIRVTIAENRIFFRRLFFIGAPCSSVIMRETLGKVLKTLKKIVSQVWGQRPLMLPWVRQWMAVYPAAYDGDNGILSLSRRH